MRSNNSLKKTLSFSILFAFALPTFAQTLQPPFPTKRPESAETWRRDGWNAIDQAKKLKLRKGKAKNVILFIGDGMGVSTLTAARIFEGQQRGESGEENRLSFEEFPFSALSKTYSANQQTSDSAPTMSAIMTGVKTDEGVLSVNQNIIHADYRTVRGNETKTLLETAEESGKSTGVVTTTRLTHATPGACYAHTADRDWESDKDIFDRKKDAYEAKFPDIARQLIEFPYGDGLEVAMGGGRQKFTPKGTPDPQISGKQGERLDGRDLTKEWVGQRAGSEYVYNKKQLAAVDPKKTNHLLGLFDATHLEFDKDRIAKNLDEPSLTDMTTKAIDVLSQNKKGFFLMVEGGRIDQAHHLGNAYRALQDTVELSNAVRAAVGKVNLDETLIIVTADHSHTLTIMGYPARGNNILGLVREVGGDGNLEADYKRDKLGRTYTTLNYANGRGYTGASNDQAEGSKTYPEEPKTFKGITNGRPDLTKIVTTDPNYMQEAMIPLGDETHGGEDVAIFAIGVNAHLIRGSMEQNWIFYVMADALRLGRK
ncbi:MAG: alkaline phosphatase [Pyrinomonadaceae bacterium]